MRAGSRRTSPAGARSRSNTSGAAGGCTGVSVSRSTREGLRRRALLDELISTPVEHELTRLLEGTDDPHDAALGLLDRLEAHRAAVVDFLGERSKEHTSELQSLIRISDADFCSNKKKIPSYTQLHNTH